jgi:sugar lactone lactonase YvrE
MNRCTWLIGAFLLPTLGACGADATLELAQTNQEARSRLRTIADPVAWPESPLYSDHKVYWVAYGSHQVFVWDGVTTQEFWSQPGCGPSAITRLPGGDFFITCYDSNTLGHISASGATLPNIATDSSGQPFLGPNDFAQDGRGGLYFSASGVFDTSAPVQGTVYFRAADGSIRQVASNIHYSNGLAVTDRGATLLVNEHLEAQTLSYRIAADGSLSGRAVWRRIADLVPTPADATGYYGVDGIKVDSRGNVYIANYGGSRIVIANSAGRFLAAVTTPYKYTDNVGLGPSLSGGSSPCTDTEEALYIASVKDDSTSPYPGGIFVGANPIR